MLTWMAEQRRFTRAPLGHAIDFSTKTDDFMVRMEGTAKDISLGGMFIETELPCPLGDELRVYLTLPRGKREMCLPAIVRWRSSEGMGVQFLLLGAADTHDITEYTATRG